MSNEEVKKEVEKMPEEVEEVSKKVAEEVLEEVQAVAEEVEQKVSRFINIVKLKCNYTIYKRERTKLKMPVIEKCQICSKKFENGDELYTAYTEKENIRQSYLICSKCAKEL